MRLLIAAVMLTAMFVALPAVTGGHAYAQLGQEVAPAGGRAPAAAPTEEVSQAAPLAAPAGAVDAELVGPQASEIEETFTPIGLFIRAGMVVKSVLLLLLLASFWSWVLIIDKLFAFSSLKRRTRQFEQNFWSGRSLDELFTQYSGRTDQPMAAVFVAALREWRRSLEKVANPKDALQFGVRDRVEKAMNVSIQRETEKLERGLSFLATVGSTAPFVGLFGTVWGIMNSFQAIAIRQDTTLAVVAPGIAEALFATALGLLAAIPAVIAYNRFVSELSRYSARLEAFADEFSAFLSRQLDERSGR
jgi:biopolymer transport protein TolQ